MTEPSITEKVPLTAKEKAKQLVKNYINVVPQDFGGMDKDLAKECARICALELFFYNTNEEKRAWWIDVINEIETLWNNKRQ